MDSWQQEYIEENLPQLIKFTDFNATLKATLLSENILSKSDVQKLDVARKTQGQQQESYEGYALLIGRTRAYEKLLEALRECKQTGAVQILENGINNQKARQQPNLQDTSKVLNTFANTETTLFTNPVSVDASSAVNSRRDVDLHSASNSSMGTNPSPMFAQLPAIQSSNQSQPNQSSNTVQVTNSSIQSPPNQAEHIEYSEEEILGRGSGGTIVYKGTFSRRDVAVKAFSFKDKLEVENEIKSLLKCDNHDNIVRYIHSEKIRNGFLIALELCEKFTLADWVEDKTCLQIDIDSINILRQATQGLGYLHQPKINIIHRDLKPSNILFFIRGNDVLVKISDFGISRSLNLGQTRRTCKTFGGTFGWTAAEMLEVESALGKSRSRLSKIPKIIPKMTKKIDVFSLGCIYYFVLTEGEHPFGDDDDLKNHHIKNGNTQLKDTYDSLPLHCNLSLVQIMIAKDPTVRPGVGYILAHPIFWTNDKMIKFIDDVSNFVNKPIPSIKAIVDSCVEKLETTYFPKISNGSPDGWFSLLDSTLQPIFIKRYKHHKKEAMKLVRIIRNFKHHYYEDTFDPVVKAHIGEIPDGFISYWLKTFPTLVNEMRDAFDDLKTETAFQPFFE